jgi:hypothetical protein
VAGSMGPSSPRREYPPECVGPASLNVDDLADNAAGLLVVAESHEGAGPCQEELRVPRREGQAGVDGIEGGLGVARLQQFEGAFVMLVGQGEVDQAFELVQGRWVVVDADVDDDPFPRVRARGWCHRRRAARPTCRS